MKHTEASVRGETRQTGVFVLGITGGVGAGKSTVLAYLHERFGALILECDRIGAQLQKKGSEVLRQIIDTFGEEYLTEDGELDRKKTAALVFADSEALSKLNAIVHPAVKKEVLDAIAGERSAAAAGKAAGQLPRIVVVESALLLDDDYESFCDEVWYIYADGETRIRRLMESRSYSREKCLQVMGRQHTDAFFREHCDLCIDNSSGDKTDTYRQIDKAVEHIFPGCLL